MWWLLYWENKTSIAWQENGTLQSTDEQQSFFCHCWTYDPNRPQDIKKTHVISINRTFQWLFWRWPIEHFSGKHGVLRWSILLEKLNHNVQKPNYFKILHKTKKGKLIVKRCQTKSFQFLWTGNENSANDRPHVITGQMTRGFLKTVFSKVWLCISLQCFINSCFIFLLLDGTEWQKAIS